MCLCELMEEAGAISNAVGPSLIAVNFWDNNYLV